jgi:hypothetical protein
VPQTTGGAIARSAAEVGAIVGATALVPPGTPGKTNALRVHRIGDAIASGLA